MKKTWWKEGVAYQIYPRSFMDANGDGIGDLRGIIEKLDYLVELGVDIVWICPIYRSPNADNGYDISDYYAIMDEFGTMDDFDELLAQAHRRGLKIILDLVINHTSDEHPWFIESRSSRDNPKRDWYIWRDGKDGREPNNWESIFGGSAWQYDERTGQYYLHLFDVKQPDLNWENSEVRQALYDMINWWLDKGIDGFRIDAISHIKKKPGLPDLPNPKGLKYVPSFAAHMNQPGIMEYLRELKEQTFARYDIMTVGEANGVTVDEAEQWVGEENGVFHMIFQFEHLGLWKRKADGSIDVRRLKRTLTKWQKGLENRGWNALFLENHDLPRSVSTWGNDGEYWAESAKALGALYFFMQGTPFIYQGQEIGMTNVQFSDIRDYRDVAALRLYELERANGRTHEEVMKIIWQTGRDNSRTPMQWSGAPNAGFTTGTPWIKVNENYRTINVEAERRDPNSVWSFYRQMIQLRKANELFVYGTYDLLLENNPSIYAYTRTLGRDRALIIVNVSDRPSLYRYDGFRLQSSDLALSNYPVRPHKNATRFKLKPYEARVYIWKE